MLIEWRDVGRENCGFMNRDSTIMPLCRNRSDAATERQNRRYGEEVLFEFKRWKGVKFIDIV